MVSNLGEAGAFVRSQESEPVADLQWHFLPAVNAYHGLDLRSMFRNFGYSITINENRPLPSGTLTLHSADPLAPPLIDPNYGAATSETERLVRGFKIATPAPSHPALVAHGDAGWGPGAPAASP